MKVSRTRFDALIRSAIRRIPDELLRHLENIAVVVENRPSKKLLEEMGMPPDETLLGLYEGVSLTERSHDDLPRLPDRILLFHEPLQEMCRTLDELEEEIEITVVHEIAHYFGIDEDDSSYCDDSGVSPNPTYPPYNSYAVDAHIPSYDFDRDRRPLDSKDLDLDPEWDIGADEFVLVQ